MFIREIELSDAGLLQLFSEHDDFMIDFLADDRRYYTRYTPAENLTNAWGLYVDDSLAGCIAFRVQGNELGEVKRLFIRKTYRGRGFSKRLIETVEAYAKASGCQTLMLDTRVTLEPAVSIYRKAGYCIVFQQGLYIQMKKTFV